jgi:hypothetical protein
MWLDANSSPSKNSLTFYVSLELRYVPVLLIYFGL